MSTSSSTSSGARSSRSRRRSRRRRSHRSHGARPDASSLHPAPRHVATWHPAPAPRTLRTPHPRTMPAPHHAYPAGARRCVRRATRPSRAASSLTPHRPTRQHSRRHPRRAAPPSPPPPRLLPLPPPPSPPPPPTPPPGPSLPPLTPTPPHAQAARETRWYAEVLSNRSAAYVTQHGQSGPLVVPELGSCASSGRAWRLWAARHPQGGEAGPLGAQPLSRPLELAASRVADSTAFDHPG